MLLFKINTMYFKKTVYEIPIWKLVYKTVTDRYCFIIVASCCKKIKRIDGNTMFYINKYLQDFRKWENEIAVSWNYLNDIWTDKKLSPI